MLPVVGVVACGRKHERRVILIHLYRTAECCVIGLVSWRAFLEKLTLSLVLLILKLLVAGAIKGGFELRVAKTIA